MGNVGKAQFVENALRELSVSLSRGNHRIDAPYAALNVRMSGSAVIPGLPVPTAYDGVWMLFKVLLLLFCTYMQAVVHRLMLLCLGGLRVGVGRCALCFLPGLYHVSCGGSHRFCC